MFQLTLEIVCDLLMTRALSRVAIFFTGLMDRSSFFSKVYVENN
jgi:hypothetical protein